MPIKIPAALPARRVLEDEGVMVMGEDVAVRQDIRPLRIALLNLMPTAIRTETETQFARLLGATPLQVELTLMRMETHKPKSPPPETVLSSYAILRDLESEKYDGLIVTGAPVETLPFEEVLYWEELTKLFDWSQRHVHSMLGICWGAQALLYHRHGVPKHQLPGKAFGCFRHRNLRPTSPYLRGFADDFLIPVSRHTEVRAEDLPGHLRVLVESDDVGLCLVEDGGSRSLYMFNHIEYDTDSLDREYQRDVSRGLPINVPANYYPDDDPKAPPENRWRSHAHLLLGNWINEVYQSTPYELEEIGNEASATADAQRTTETVGAK